MALGAGSIAFVGFNADGNDGFAFIAVDAIPAGTVIHFQDNEWGGASFNAGEGSLTWTAPATEIARGTVVELLNTSEVASRVANIGTISGGTIALGANGESIFAFIGTSATAPTTFLAAVTNNNGGFIGSTSSGLLDGTGLTAGTNALVLPGTGGADVAVYNPTTGGTSFASTGAALSAFNNAANWLTQDASSNQDADNTIPDAPFLTDPQSPLSSATISIACYAAGTMILTPQGEVPVETLAIGDALITAFGETRAIKWIGTRAYAGHFVKWNRDVLPITFRAGSIADNTPHRDLVVSPQHAMFIDDVLIPAIALVNGTSITQATSIDRIAYFHIELDSHDVIIAEGAFAETFIDDDSRAMFHNAHSFRTLYPNEPWQDAQFCAPRVEDGFEFEEVRTRLATRGETLVGRLKAA